jgi:hypothetical protein
MVFMGWLLAHARQFHEAYNAALVAYRRLHKVRGRGRPMPELAVRTDSAGDGPWYEVPWWIWSRDDRRRRRVFASMSPGGTLTLSDLETVRVELPISPDTSPSKWVDALSRMEEHALRLRPRAIVTTMLSRLLIADVFVHGTGGAAYVELTDSIVRQLTGCDPPRLADVRALRQCMDAGRTVEVDSFKALNATATDAEPTAASRHRDPPLRLSASCAA